MTGGRTAPTSHIPSHGLLSGRIPSFPMLSTELAQPAASLDTTQEGGPSEDPNKTLQNQANLETGNVPGTGAMFVKIVSLAITSNGADGGISALPLISLEFPEAPLATFRTVTKLEDVRTKLVAKMQKKQPFKFCIDDCSVVPDDITLEAYGKMLRGQASLEQSALSVYIVATVESSVTQQAALLKPPFMIKFIQVGETPDRTLNVGSLHSTAFNGKDPSPLPLRELRRLMGRMSSNPQMHTFCTLDGSAAADNLPLKEYLGLDGEKIEHEAGIASIIVRYRKTDAKVHASKFHGASPEVLAAMERMKPNLEFTDRTSSELKMDRTPIQIKEELDASRFAARNANPLKYTSMMDETDWDHVLRNCSLLYGWAVDPKTDQIVQASAPAFRLRPKIFPTAEPIHARATASTSPSREAELPTSSSDPSIALVPAATVLQEPALSAEDLDAPVAEKPTALPSYAVNDRSRIDVTLLTSTFQESMAKNNFSSKSIEASVSGGYAGYSVGVTGGMREDKEDAHASSRKSYTKTLIANYMFPRVTVSFRPEELEPTPELQAAIDLIRQTKNINALRKLHATFGQFFCREVTLGGCLQSTKVLTGKEDTDTSKQSELFKGQVGLAVSTPIGVGASVKTSTETQKKEEKEVRTTESRESMIFEATGGNTILAADPPNWCGSVADFNNWRVIDRAQMHVLVDMLGQIKGFEEIKSWVFSAVPKLSQYLVIPASRILHVRLKVASDISAIARTMENGYLGHDPMHPPMPYRTSLQKRVPTEEVFEKITSGPWGPILDMTTTATQVTVHNRDAMFWPHAPQAPVLSFPKGKEIGSKMDPSLLQTTWRFEIATGHSLGTETLISIKSVAKENANIGLSVYRNAQGVFLPCITSSDEPAFWRLERVENQGSEERLKHSEIVRLTWRFSDQSSGFRDYNNDTYGRRNMMRPADCPSDILYMKVPFPRFENWDEGRVSLVMSPAATDKPLIQQIKVLPLKNGDDFSNGVATYTFYDITFRLDSVGDNPRGDADDYMNIVTEPHAESLTSEVVGKWTHHKEPPMQKLLGGSGPAATIAGIMFGPIALPIAGIGRVLGGIFGL